MSFLQKKSFGQHFLHEKGVIERIADLVQPAHTLVEIGPGEGALTRELQKRSQNRLILAEADRSLFEYLEATFHFAELVKGDAAKVDFANIVTSPWVCVGNLPYNAAAAIMSHVIRKAPRPEQCVFMIQREQADRVCAEPGDMSMLSLAIQLYGEVSRCFHVSPGSFSPPPKVDSTVIEIIPYADADERENEAILALAQHGFQHRRKQLLRSLVRAGYEETLVRAAFLAVGLPPRVRPQEISIGTWRALFHSLSKTVH